METISFKTPWILFIIPPIIVLLAVITRRQKTPSVRYSSNALFSSLRPSMRIWFSNRLIILRIIAVVLFLTALAGPQKVLDKTEISTEGIDIILAVDASGSMAAMDFQLKGKRVNRLEAVKDVVEDFVGGRSGDRIGLVVFGEQAYTACPLTTDYNWLIENLRRLELGIIQDNGTAIGSAITTSLGRLEGRESKSKVVILLTDGVNNAGSIDPIQAANAAEVLGVRIYTVGAGTDGLAPYPARDLFGNTVLRNMRVEFDEKTLKQIAKISNGEYFGANDTEALRSVYKKIDQLEKTEIKETGYKEYRQLFSGFVYAGIVFLFMAVGLNKTVLMRIP